MNLTNKVVIITGASGAIGEAAAKAFDRAGATLVLASRRIGILQRTAAGLREATALAIDISKEGQAREMIRYAVEKYGRVDILINNAAAIIVDRSEKVSSEDLLTAFMANLVGPVVAIQEAIVQMKRQGGGHIINVGSPGFMMGIPFYAPYVCSKAALSAWTRTIQAEWANSKIIVSEYFPGYIKTNSLADSRIGPVDQDFLMAEKQNFLARYFTASKTPEHVSEQLIRLALRPRTLVYSGFLVKMGAFLSNIPSFRLKIASQLARNAEIKLKKDQSIQL